MGELDKLLKQYASRPTAAPPDNLEDRVWREIRLRQEQRLADSFVDWLAGRVWRARSVYACVISAVAMGVALAWLDLGASAGQPGFDALNLEVFSEQSPTLRLSNLYQ